MTRWKAQKKNELITIVVGVLILSGCGGSSSETPMPLEPAPHVEDHSGQTEVVQGADPQKPSETEASDAPAPN